MVATVQGGMSTKEFNRAIRSGGQWLPLDGHPTKATIGGIVAANTYGPRAGGYGTVRDMVLGMTVINGDGVVRKCGGKVVKNVTGYALDKLYIGSFGTLGLITEVTFKLRPLPIDGMNWNSEPFDSTADAVDAMSSVASKNLPIEMLNLANLVQGANPRLYISATGPRAELIRIDTELTTTHGKKIHADMIDPRTMDRETQMEWAYRQSWQSCAYELDLIEKMQSRITPGAALRFGVAASKLKMILEVIGLREKYAYSIGTNVGIVDISPLNETEAARIAGEFEKLGVNFAWENIVGVNIPNRWGAPRPEWALMKQIKAALDPQGIMNPGRFVV